MRWTGVAAIAVGGLAIPTMVFAQGSPAWCGGSYGPQRTNFGPCQAGQANPQVAGQASGIQGQSVQTVPEYPANQVTFRDGRAYHNGQELNVNSRTFPERNDVQSPGDSN